MTTRTIIILSLLVLVLGGGLMAADQLYVTEYCEHVGQDVTRYGGDADVYDCGWATFKVPS